MKWHFLKCYKEVSVFTVLYGSKTFIKNNEVLVQFMQQELNVWEAWRDTSDYTKLKQTYTEGSKYVFKKWNSLLSYTKVFSPLEHSGQWQFRKLALCYKTNNYGHRATITRGLPSWNRLEINPWSVEEERETDTVNDTLAI